MQAMVRSCATSLLALLVSACFSPNGSDSTSDPPGTVSETQATGTSTSTSSSETTSSSGPTTTSTTLPTTSSSSEPTTEQVDPSTTWGSSTGVETTSSSTMPGFCGDDMVGPDEECDDGNDVQGDGCFNCKAETSCGDGIVDPGEECDGTEGCDGCMRSYFRVFVTASPVTVGELGGLDGADKLCTQRAQDEGLTGDFVAWLSIGSQSAASRLAHSTRPWRMLNDLAIANDWEDLKDGGLGVALTITETGGELPIAQGCGACPVWTATTTVGLPMAGNCSDWGAPGMTSADVGECSLADSRWTEGCPPIQCSASARLYCFEQPPLP